MPTTVTSLFRRPQVALVRLGTKGASLFETGLLVGLISVVAIFAVSTTGSSIESAYCRAANLLSGTTGDCVTDIDGSDGPTTPGGGGSSGGGGESGTDPDDGAPDVAGLSARLGWPDRTETFDGIAVSGFDGQLPIMFIDPEPGWLMTVETASGTVMGQGPFTVEAGGTLALTLTVPSSGITRNVGFRIGDAEFALPVTGGDVLADPFAIPTVADAIGTTWTESAMVTPTGFDLALPIAVSGRDALLFIGDSTTGVAAGTLAPGESFRIGMISDPESGEPVSTSVTLGQLPDVVSAGWSVTAVDLTPDAIVFADTTGHAPGDWAYSSTVEVSGIEGMIPIAVTGGQISVDNAPWATVGSVGPFGQVRLRQRIPATALAAEGFDVTALFGAVRGRPGVTATWHGMAGGTDRVPDAFAIPNLLAGEPSQRNLSVPVTLAGFDAAVQVRVTGDGNPMVSIDDGAFVTAGSGSGVVLLPGQSFELSVLGEGHGTSRSITVEVGNFTAGETVSATWTATVRGVDLTPEAGYRVPDIATPQAYKATVESATMTPAGFGDPIGVVASGPHAANTTISVNGGAWTAGSGGLLATLVPGDSFRLRHHVSLADGAPRAVTLAFGEAEPYAWQIATLDMLPDSFDWPDQYGLNPGESVWLRADGGSGDFVRTVVSGLGDGVVVPVGVGLRSFASMEATSSESTIVYSITNGSIIGYSFATPNAPGETRTISIDLGGMLLAFDVEILATPSDPKNYQFASLLSQPVGRRAHSEWRTLQSYGSSMVVDFSAGDATKKYQVWRSGEASFDPAYYNSVTINPGDQLRVSLDHASAGKKSATLRFNSASCATACLTYAWTSQTAPSTDLLPNALAAIDYGAGPHSTLVNNGCQIIKSASTGNNKITGFDGAIRIWLEASGGSVVGANLAGATLQWQGTADGRSRSAALARGAVVKPSFHCCSMWLAFLG